MRAIFLTMLLSLMSSCLTPQKNADMKKVDLHLQSLVEKGKTPSVVYLLFNADSLIHSYHSGYANVGQKVPARPTTTYSGFSITKTFTALAILQLAEKKMLNIEDPAEHYILDFPYPGAITIRHLLNHSAGLPNPLPLKWVHAPEENPTFDRDEFFKQVSSKSPKVQSAPNEKFSYSNLGYYYLGKIIEKVSGKSYEDYVYEHIVEPLGLTRQDLGFEIHHGASHATGYQKKWSMMNFLLGFLMDKSKYTGQTEGKWVSFRDILLNGPSHGGLIGTPESFMIYLQELLRPNSPILSDQFKDLLFKENQLNSKKASGMCLSWFKGQLYNTTYFAHAGGGAGYYSEIRVYPELGLGSVIMFNRTGMSDERVLDQFDQYYIETVK